MSFSIKWDSVPDATKVTVYYSDAKFADANDAKHAVELEGSATSYVVPGYGRIYCRVFITTPQGVTRSPTKVVDSYLDVPGAGLSRLYSGDMISGFCDSAQFRELFPDVSLATLGFTSVSITARLTKITHRGRVLYVPNTSLGNITAANYYKYGVALPQHPDDIALALEAGDALEASFVQSGHRYRIRHLMAHPYDDIKSSSEMNEGITYGRYWADSEVSDFVAPIARDHVPSLTEPLYRGKQPIVLDTNVTSLMRTNTVMSMHFYTPMFYNRSVGVRDSDTRYGMNSWYYYSSNRTTLTTDRMVIEYMGPVTE